MSPRQADRALSSEDLLEDYLDRALAPMVRAVPLRERRRLRAEWSDHLVSLSQEARTQEEDEAAAMRAALSRFGDPAELGRRWTRQWVRDRGGLVSLPAVVGVLLLGAGALAAVACLDQAHGSPDGVIDGLWIVFAILAPLLMGAGARLLFPLAPTGPMTAVFAVASLLAGLAVQRDSVIGSAISVMVPGGIASLCGVWLAMSTAGVLVARAVFPSLLLTRPASAPLARLMPGVDSLTGRSFTAALARSGVCSAVGTAVGVLVFPIWACGIHGLCPEMGPLEVTGYVRAGPLIGVILGLLLGPALSSRYCMSLAVPAVSLIPACALLSAMFTPTIEQSGITFEVMVWSLILIGGAVLVTLTTALAGRRILSWLTRPLTPDDPWRLEAAS
ncbi:MAG TPA: hypothetical protein VGN26_09535 [Armatimonadota bacterium]